MAGRHFGAVYRRIERIFAAGSVAGLSEGELLERFATRGDEAAFEAILARHGPMVLGICRKLLRDPHDVEDAFQATFLVLVHKAGSLRQRDLVGNWLFGVASRVALRARVVARRRRESEEAGDATLGRAEAAPEDDRERESEALIHEEVRHLPEKYRIPVLLCYLEGLTHEEAARQLGWPLGTVKGRLARARDLLRKRLTRRGVTLSASAVSAAVARQAEATVPAALVQSTIKAALAVAAGRALAAGVVAANVAALTKGVSDAMFLNTLKLAVMVLVAGVLTTGAGVVAFQGEAGPVGGAAPPSPKTITSVTADVPRDTRKAEDAQLLDAAQRMFDSQWAAYAKGRIAVDRIADASRRWLEAQLSTSGSRPDRAAAYRAHLKRMEKLEAYEYSALPKHQGMDENFTAARFLRLQAEKLLAGAVGSGDALPPPVASSPPPRDVAAVPPTGRVAVREGAGSGGSDLADQANAAAERLNRLEIAKLAPRVAARDKAPATQAVLRALETPLDMSSDNETALQDILKYIKSKTRGAEGESVSREITIYIDPVALEEQNLDPKTTLVTINLEGVPLRTSLRLLLKQLNLAYCIKDGMVIISSVDGVLEELKEAEAVEDVAGTIPHPPSAGEANEAGPAKAAPEQRPDPVVADQEPTPVLDLGEQRSEALEKRLDEPVNLAFTKETPLEDVFAYLEKSVRMPDGSGLPIYVDPDERTRLKSLVEIDLPGVPLRTTLKLLLNQVGLEWTVQDGLLIISTGKTIERISEIAYNITPDDEPDHNQLLLLPKLVAPVTLTFPEMTPLDEVIKAIRTATRRPEDEGVPIYLGPPVNIYKFRRIRKRRSADVRSELVETKKVGSMLVSIELKDVPFRTCLALVLAQTRLDNRDRSPCAHSIAGSWTGC